MHSRSPWVQASLSAKYIILFDDCFGNEGKENGKPDKTGSPDEIFSNGYIKELFDIDDEYAYGISDVRQVIK